MKMAIKTKLMKIYEKLLDTYGPQGWWPIINSKTLLCEYHPGKYSYPENQAQVFEICVGSLLTQSILWQSVEKALLNLKKRNALNPKVLINLNEYKLKEAIKPAGYFNQKAIKLREFTKFFIKLKGTPTRKQLLNVWGVGPETADSIMLYAFKKPIFVVDVYTQRIFSRIGLINSSKYDEVQDCFYKNLEQNYKLFNEYHALIVEHGKKYCRRKPSCKICPLNNLCQKKL